MNLSKRTKIVIGAVAATVVIGVAGIAFATDGDRDGDADFDLGAGQGTVQSQ